MKIRNRARNPPLAPPVTLHPFLTILVIPLVCIYERKKGDRKRDPPLAPSSHPSLRPYPFPEQTQVREGV